MRNIFSMEKFGLIPDTLDPRDVWEDEVLGGEEIPIPESFRIEGLEYIPQGSYPYCVAMAATTLAKIWYNKETEGERHQFSQPHLFFNSKGNENGSSFRENLNTLVKSGAISYERLPMPDVSVGRGNGWYEREKLRASTVPFDGAKKIGGFVRVQSDEGTLKRAIMRYGGVLVGVAAGSGDYYTGNGKRVKNTDNHAVLLVGWNKTHWIIFDSLWWVKNNGGYGTLDGSYTFPSVYAITSLPEDWKEKRNESRKVDWENVLNHYGKKYSFTKEIIVSRELLDKFNETKIQSLIDASGRFWDVYVNAIAYGGYKYGDIINDCYSWTRTGQHIFDFNNETREQWSLRIKK